MSNSLLKAGRPSKGRKSGLLENLKDKPANKRVNFEIPIDLHLKLKTYVAKHDTNIKELFTKFIDELPEK